MSLYMLLQQGSQPAGAFIMGVLATHLGAPVALVMACGLAMMIMARARIPTEMSLRSARFSIGASGGGG